MRGWVALCACLAAVGPCMGFYIPGVTPMSYETGENVTVKVNSIKSTKTAIPYDYYSLMFCRPAGDKKGRIKGEVENFGELLWGDRIKPSKYWMQMKTDVPCSRLCISRPKENDPKSRHLRKLKARIDDEYRGHLILDNLPVSEVFIWEGGSAKQELYYRRGYPLGLPGNKTHHSLVNNHLAFTIKYHKPESGGNRIVGFNVVAHSVDSAVIDKECRTNPETWSPSTYPPQPIILKPGEPITKSISWSYSVKWEEEPDVAWSSRWDHYLHSAEAANAQIHWFSVINSLLVVLLLSGVVAGILLRALHKDFNQYNHPDNEDEAQEETGWKLVHGDVFRTPRPNAPLSVLIGSGVQLVSMAGVTLIFACFGFLSPANRGALMMTMLVLYTVFGVPAGFTAARLSKMFHNQKWDVIFYTAVFLPGSCFAVFFLLDLILWAMGAANAVPFKTLSILMGLWFGVSLPLVFFGGVLGYRRPTIQRPLEVNKLPRAIPKQRWYLQPQVTILASGQVPFGATFIELYFIMSSLWLNRFYYVFGFVALVFIILVLACAEITIVVVYLQLCYEDYNWWWRAFLSAASAGVYLFVYSLYYLTTYMELHSWMSYSLYFCYMGLLSFLFAIACGTVGFLSALLFVRKIYAVLKVD